ANPGRSRSTPEPLKVLGKNPATDTDVRIMEGRYGAYVTDGSVNATIPKDVNKDELTLDVALQLIAERAAKAPAKKGKKPAAKKAAPKKVAAKKDAPAKKPAAKKAPAQKAPAKKAAPKKAAKAEV
ncbi:MAG: DNA topoisomerase I, partial [Blastomonas sp.]|nr:DNA topoisomerase I [Blastomonas sp.]